MGKRKTKKDHAPELAVIGELYEEQEADVVKDLLEIEPGGRVTIYIDSAGGSVYSALTISSLIRVRHLKATAIVLGECSSATLLVFATCQERYVTPRSVFLFHRVRWRSDKDVRSEEASNWASHFNWLESEVDRYQANLFGVVDDKFRDWIQEGRFVLGPELVTMKLAKLLDI